HSRGDRCKTSGRSWRARRPSTRLGTSLSVAKARTTSMNGMPDRDQRAVTRTADARAVAVAPRRVRRGAGTLDVRVSDERGRAVHAAGLGPWLARVAPARARGLVSVALVSDRRVRALNRTYRRQDY